MKTHFTQCVTMNMNEGMYGRLLQREKIILLHLMENVRTSNKVKGCPKQNPKSHKLDMKATTLNPTRRLRKTQERRSSSPVKHLNLK